MAVGIWWHKNKDNQQIFSAKSSHVEAEVTPLKTETEIRLTDLSKMRSMLNPPNNQIMPLENHGG